MNVLFLAHPGSVHDLSWMTSMAAGSGIRCFCVARKADKRFLKPGFISQLEEKQITFCGFIPDFSIVRPWQTIKGFSLLSNIIKKHGIDLFHILYAEPSALWVSRKKFLGIPVVITTRGSDILITIQNTFKSGSVLNTVLKKLYKSAFLKADFITCTSLKQIKVIKALTKRDKGLEIIRTGVDVKAILKAADNELPIALRGKSYVFFPRAMHPVYQHELALEAVKGLPDKLKKEYVFVFLDADSKDKDYVSFIRDKMAGMPDCLIEFFPKLSQEKVFKLYREASLVVMTPLTDGSPVSALEAMATRTSVLMPDLDYDNEIFNETTVSFFRNSDSKNLGEKIRQLLFQDAEDVKTKNAFDVVSKMADRNSEMKKLVEIYKSIQ